MLQVLLKLWSIKTTKVAEQNHELDHLGKQIRYHAQTPLTEKNAKQFPAAT